MSSLRKQVFTKKFVTEQDLANLNMSLSVRNIYPLSSNEILIFQDEYELGTGIQKSIAIYKWELGEQGPKDFKELIKIEGKFDIIKIDADEKLVFLFDNYDITAISLVDPSPINHIKYNYDFGGDCDKNQLVEHAKFLRQSKRMVLVRTHFLYYECRIHIDVLSYCKYGIEKMNSGEFSLTGLPPDSEFQITKLDHFNKIAILFEECYKKLSGFFFFEYEANENTMKKLLIRIPEPSIRTLDIIGMKIICEDKYLALTKRDREVALMLIDAQREEVIIELPFSQKVLTSMQARWALKPLAFHRKIGCLYFTLEKKNSGYYNRFLYEYNYLNQKFDLLDSWTDNYYICSPVFGFKTLSPYAFQNYDKETSALNYVFRYKVDAQELQNIDGDYDNPTINKLKLKYSTITTSVYESRLNLLLVIQRSGYLRNFSKYVWSQVFDFCIPMLKN